jgi:Zn-dependent peptidase ImmA (M78 family)/formiminotetrahydrofolate cyclodeaminase
MEGSSLLDLPTSKLLEKFGAGNHKPGSGSAAAFQGMLSSQLIHTVISITFEPKHKSKYENHISRLSEIDADITGRIYPTLGKLFQEDAILFDKVIKLRRERDDEKDPGRRKELSVQALLALKPATDILIKIGDLCADLADYGAFVFDNAFKSAKGDSAVALSGAVASVGGCLSIIDLNLSLFGSDQWTVKIREEADRLRKDFKKLSDEAKSRMDNFTVEGQQKSFQLAKSNLASGRWGGVRISDKNIEQLADQVHNALWDFRDLIWPKDVPQWHQESLKPEMALEKILDYQYGYASLGVHDENGVTFQIAGQVNNKDKVVVISKDLNADVRNFTAAHELGHALLHPEMDVLHRDRPIDGSGSGTRDIREIQANKFAAYFLMPRTIVNAVFQEIFGMDKFAIDTNSLFKVGGGSMFEFRRRHPNLRALSRFVARYKGGTFQPLHKIFGVSPEAMAIRLEELELVLY